MSSTNPDWKNMMTGDMWTQVWKMIDNGHDLSLPGHNDTRPLHWASCRGDAKLVELILSMNVPVDPKDNNGWTPLINAVVASREETVYILLDNGADASVQENPENPENPAFGGWTPLHHAVRNSDFNVVKMLLDAGADAQLVNNANETPIDLATRLIAENPGPLPFKTHSRTAIIDIITQNIAHKTVLTRQAFAMGNHDRLGVGSQVQSLDDGMVRMVLEYV
jgi:hypothetical protein